MKTTKKVLTDPTLEKHLHGHKSQVTGLCFDQQTKQLVSGSHDHCLMVWNLKDKMRAFKFIGHSDVVSDVCFSPVGQLLASSSFDRTVRIWAPTLGGSSGEIKAHTKAVQSVHFSYDGLTLLTASNDKTVKEWSVQRKSFLSTFTGHTNWVLSARFSNDAKTVVTASDDRTIKYFDRRARQCIHTFLENKVPQKAIYHPSDTCIAAAFTEKTIKLYDLRILKQLQLYKCHEDDVLSIDFHPNGNYLLSASRDGSTKIIDLLEGRTLYTLEGNRGPLTAIATSPDGTYFANGGQDGQILLWRANFEEIVCDEDETIKSPGEENLTDTTIGSKSEPSLEVTDCLLPEKNETLETNENVETPTLNGDNNEEKSCDKDSTCCSRMDAILDILHKMRAQISSMDERCKRLESLYLNSG
ncbi:UNVERIFIED_CONTAM: hypothetical protein PYX00_000577 [Menopon gallinae]|uniref:Uncharacterized protein n=1 Tax=Menopon gallinae TaxID=328185 RepID=A0AAW2IAF4_9NEOP